MNFLSKTLSKLFGGNKYEKDIKAINPLVEQINAEFDRLTSVSNDELRNRTTEFRTRIKEYIKDIDTELTSLKNEAESSFDMEDDKKEEIYERVDKLTKTRDEKIEEVLNEILPEAFAVVKETARRFKENDQLEATATDLDRDLSVERGNIIIDGEKVIYKSTWLAGGNEVSWDMVHYDVQLIGGVVLHQGKIAEMATGEGKTLVATLPAYLNSLAGEGVHLVTVNDYLAKRDSEWMGPIFQFLGVTIDCIDKYQPHSPERRAAYLSDITYGTNNEFGFDYLRDNMVRLSSEMVQRKHHFAMIDEVDSVLVDDARTPLIISGPVPKGDDQQFQNLKPEVMKLVDAQKRITNQFLVDAKRLIKEGKNDEGGLCLLRAFRGLPKNKALIKYLSEEGIRTKLQKTENFFLQDNARRMPEVDEELYFIIDEKNNSVELGEKGIELVTGTGEDTGFFILPDVGAEIAEIDRSELTEDEKILKKDALMQDFSVKSERLHAVHQLLKAYALFEKDVEYVVIEDKVKIVDEQTGRIMEGRRYSDGLHQAIETKENVKVEAATQTFATVTLQNFFRMYHKLAGMTGTAETEAGEFWEIYKLDVTVIPTNRPIVRDDMEDLVFKTTREKYNSVIDEIESLVNKGRPVLVGTTSVEVSELLSRLLLRKGIKHNVLNAKQHQREAEIVAEAGQPGTVTIATNMAGRGTDIKLGKGVVEAGGLAILGTERHDSRRVDRQLRGRAGRQGDPGSSIFYVSLEDNLMRLFGSERISGVMDKMGYKDGEVIQHSMITKSIERAQRKVEENNFGIRKRLLEYDDVMNSQRERIYTRRRHALEGERLSVDLNNSFHDLSWEIVESNKIEGDYENFKMEVIRSFGMDPKIDEDAFRSMKQEELSDILYNNSREFYKRKSKALQNTAFPLIANLYETRGETLDRIIVPFTDGNKAINVPVNLKDAYDSEGVAIIRAFEKNITLALIDDAWKEHLRNMDDLKQSVQAAVYEQKDPLLIYKFEALELFKQMVTKVNRSIASFIYKGTIPLQKADEVRQARERKTDMSQMRAGREDSGVYNGNRGGANGAPGAADQPKALEPVRVEKKIGRNEPCPCGSGKKYKQCHGRGE